MMKTCALVAIGAGLLATQAGLAGDGGFEPFTEEAATRGVFYFGNFGFATWGSGVSFADLDNDGDPDLIATGTASGLVGVWENDGTGFFTDRTFDAFLPAAPSNNGTTCADYDRDGDLDIYITVEMGVNKLMRNDGGFVFTDVTATAGVGDPGRSQGAAWADVDEDGWLDLFFGARAASASPIYNKYFRNNGDGTFTDETDAMGLFLFEAATFQGNFWDPDNDGDLDLYLANDKGRPGGFPCNRFYTNENGVFVDTSDASNAGVCMDGMSVTLGDFNGDSTSDVFVTNAFDGNVFLFGNGDGTFTRAEGITGTTSFRFSWGNQMIDLDNDGFLELFVLAQFEDNHLFRHEGTFPAIDIAAEAGLLDIPGDNYCVAYADIENDGDMDLAVTSQGGSIRLFINHEGEKRNWLRLRPLGPEGITAYNSKATITIDGVKQYTEFVPTSGYKSQNQMLMHFGVGEATVIDRVDVVWPDGRSIALTDVAANQTLDLTPPPAACNAADIAAEFGVLNTNDIIDFVNGFNAGSPSADVSPPGGDGLFNANDIIEFVNAFNAGCP